MGKNTFNAIICVLVFSSLAFGCKPSESQARHKAGGYFQTSFQEESQFIVESIVSDLAEQVYFSEFHRLPDGKRFSVAATEVSGSSLDQPVYELLIDLDSKHSGLKIRLDVNGPIWSPEIYADVVTFLASNVGLEKSQVTTSSDTSLLTKLTDGSADTIERQNQKLSNLLEDDFTNPSLHEQAAVLLGAFTLREHSGDFYEIRSPLCRITAHLAMADYFNAGQTASLNAQMGKAMLLSLMNNQAEAVKELDNIPTNDVAVANWIRALRAYNTGDYRPLDKADNLSEIECIEWFRALNISANSDIAWGKLSESQKQKVDFVRIANEGNYSVGMGHELLARTLPLEFGEIAAIYQAAQQKDLQEKDLVAALNQPPDRCFSTSKDNKPKTRIIGWGLWAAFLQRQLCHAVQQDFNFLQRRWGVPDEAKKFSDKCNTLLSGLRLYPFVERFNCIDVETYHKAVDDGFKVTIATPQLVPAECWNYLCYWFTPQEYYHPNPNPHINEWHRHNPPPGTAYNPLPRLDHPSLIDHPEKVDKIHELAPYDSNISWYLWKTKYQKNPTFEQASTLFEPVLAYDCNAIKKVAATVQNQPDVYERLLIQAAKIDPSDYYTLADYFAQQNADKAAGYLEKGHQLDPDSVRASYHSSWLIKYYLAKGLVADARREADFAGDVYSSVGLQAKAEFLEATDDYTGAFQWFSHIEERYEDSGPLTAFCLRYKTKTGDSRYDNEAQKRIGKFFPNGLEKVQLANFKSPPNDGVLVKTATTLALTSGLKAGTVIVAVYGIRTHNFEQYQLGREINNDPVLDLIVWQDNSYKEIKASPPNHRFGGDFGDYVTR